MHGKKVVQCIKPCIKQLPVTETYVYLPRHDGLPSRCYRIQRKDYIHFLFIARGAAYEAEAQLIACADLELIDRNTLKSLYSQTVKVIHLFNALIKALKKGDPNTLSEGIECYGEDDMPDADWEEWEEYPPTPNLKPVLPTNV